MPDSTSSARRSSITSSSSPSPQRDALGTAFGLTGGRTPPDPPFLVGLAVLSLLSEAASRRPVICLVDDVQWLDQTTKSVLAFVARRLREDAVGIVFGERDGDEETALPGVARIVVEGGCPMRARERFSPRH